MMDELDLLKKDWQNKDDHLPKLSYNELYNMIWKKSSSIVKWILIISVLEFVLPHLLYLLPSTREGLEIYTGPGFSKYLIGASIIQYSVVVYFIYQFYKRYQEISVLDDAKKLMKKIIKTRRTVKNYIIFSLTMILFMFILVAAGIYFNDDFLNNFTLAQEAKNLNPEQLKNVLTITMLIAGVLMVLLMGAIYFFLYGRLVRKLKVNYKELKKLEI